MLIYPGNSEYFYIIQLPLYISYYYLLYCWRYLLPVFIFTFLLNCPHGGNKMFKIRDSKNFINPREQSSHIVLILRKYERIYWHSHQCQLWNWASGELATGFILAETHRHQFLLACTAAACKTHCSAPTLTATSPNSLNSSNTNSRPGWRRRNCSDSETFTRCDGELTDSS